MQTYNTTLTKGITMNALELTPQIEFQQSENWAHSLIVVTKEDYGFAAEKLKETKSMRKQIVEFFADPKQKAHETWKSIVSREKFFTDKLDAIETIVKKKMLAFTNEQERIRREEEARLRKIAEEQAEAERKRMIANAKRNETRGNEDRAAEWKEKAEEIKPIDVYIAPVKIKAEGIQTKKVWRGSIEDVGKFLLAASQNPKLQQHITININSLVRQFADNEEIPGIKFFQEETIAAKAV